MTRHPPLSDNERSLRRKQSVARYNEKNREKQREYMLEYNQREYVKEKIREYKKSTPTKCSLYQANYRAAKAKRTVSWETELTAFVLEEAHHLRGIRDSLFPFRWDVDHIVPLRGNMVSGLHVWNNLQVVPSSYNRSKGNKYDH